MFYTYESSLSNFNTIDSNILNMMRILNIGSRSIILFQEQFLNQLHFNKFIFKNQYVSNRIESDLTYLENLISTSQNSQEVNEILSENMCPYTWTIGAAGCESRLQGLATRGARILIYYFVNQYRVEENYIKDRIFTRDLVIELHSRDYKGPMYTLIAKSMIPALYAFGDRFSQRVLTYLEEKSNRVIEDFIVSVVVDVMSLWAMILMVYRVIKRERSVVVSTIKHVPIDFILADNNFKMYLIKDNIEFIRMFRYAEAMKSRIE